MRKLGAAAILILLITACSPFSSGKSVSPVKEEASSSEILADCFRNLNLSAWIDADSDGVWGNSEQPLEGVEFVINGNFASIVTEHPCISNEEGKCTIGIWAPGECAAGNYTITAICPEPCKATIPAETTLSLASAEFSAEARFGFYCME